VATLVAFGICLGVVKLVIGWVGLGWCKWGDLGGVEGKVGVNHFGSGLGGLEGWGSSVNLVHLIIIYCLKN